MAEKLPDVVNDQTESEESNVGKVKKLLTELELKRETDKQEVMQSLNAVSQVKEVEDETVYANLFGLVVRDCVDAILKKEVMQLTYDKNQFRNNIAQGIDQDKSLDEEPLDLFKFPEGFKEAWKRWRQGDTEDWNKKSFQRKTLRPLCELFY